MVYPTISLRRVLAYTLASLVPAVAWLLMRPTSDAQPAKQKPPPTAFECRFTDTPIKITGKGTDPAWKLAQVIDNFYLPWLAKISTSSQTWRTLTSTPMSPSTTV
jgi:hypothetical protein